MFSAFCFSILLGLTANAQSITVSGGLTASQMAQALVGTNVTVTNATFTGAAGSAGLFNQASSTFPLTDGIILTSGSINNALGPNNSTGSSTANNFPGDADLNALIPGYNTFDAAVLEFDITSNCNTVTFDYIFASEEYLEYGCSSFNDVFGFLITGPGYAPNTNIALVPGTTTPVSINNVINSPATGCVSNPTYYVDNAAGVATQYDGYTVVMTATATIQPCQTYHVKIVVGDAGDSVLDSAIFLKGGGINCSNPNLTATATTTGVECGSLGSIDVTVSSGTGPFTYAWTGPNGFTSSSEDLTGLAAGDYTVDINGSDCLSSGQFTFNVPNNPDVTAPVISNCPTDVTVTATSGCSAAVNFTAPTATDNCGTATLTSNYSSGDVFPVGTTAVTYTATDGSGNTSTCTFNVTVNAAPMSVSLTPSMFNGGVNIRCYGQNSGWADADVTGGCGPYTYDWVINGTSIPNGPDLVTGLYAGSVTVVVTDANGTSVTQNVTLVQNPPVQSVPTATPILCYGGTSTITVTATGGTAPYAGTNTYSNMGPGTYQFTVADANGCRDRQPITITQPDLLDVTATPTAIICNGDTSEVTVAATGGTMPYTGTGVYPQVAGAYSYTVTDANGCSETVDLTINEPAPLTALASYTPILCNGGTSQVTVSVISGTEPYTGIGVFTEYAGTYTYQVYDYNLCEDTVTITIPEPPVLVVTATAASIDCNGGSADVVVSATGGTAPYTGTGTYNETAGTYTYVVTDANGCTDSATVTMAEPTPLSASIASTGIDCFGGTADITVTATGGTAPYTGTGVYNVGPGSYSYVVTDANGCSFVTDTITITEPTQMTAYASCPGITCNGGTTDLAVTAFGGTPPYTGAGIFTVTAGTYTYTITDANGCTASVTHTITEPAPLVVSISSTGIDCNGGTADLTVTATGGTAPYTGTGTFNVAAGTYSYTVTDANGCSTTETITVAEPAPLVATATAASILCNGGSADVTVTATGGTAPYTGTGIFNESAGTYTYTVTDANGCTATTSVTLTEPSLMTAYASCPAIDCNGGTADMAIFAFGGTPPYSGIGVFNVGAGTYTYTVTDANGCTATVTHTVTEPAPLVVSISSTGIDCNGGTADLTVTATGGTAPYTGTGTFNVAAGTYSYTVTDANGCSTTETITVAEPTPLVATATAASILCNGGSADVTVTATGGTAPYTGTGIFNESAGTYTYTVTDANGCTATTSVTLTEPSLMTAYASCPGIACNGGTTDLAVTAFGGTPPYTGTGVFNVGAGIYTYTITDANGCTASVTHTITEPAPLVVSISSTGIDCNGGSADLAVSAIGGTAPYTGTGAYSVSAGTYTYTVTDANGCSSSETITVTEPTVLSASATSTSILCNGGSSDITVTATGGTAPYSGTGVYSETAGTYTYTVTDANGCSTDVTITVTEPAALSATATVGTYDCSTDTAPISVAATGGTAPYTGVGVFNEAAGNYTYTVTDANGCTATTNTVTVDVQYYVDLTCPGDQVYACTSNQSCGSSSNGATVSWDEPTASSFSTCNTGCGPVQQICGYNYIGEYGGSRYYRSSSSSYTWLEANNAATLAGGYLVSIGSAGENQFVQSQLGCYYAWIGYNDQNMEGSFEWTSGENLTYENWANYEPNNGGGGNSCGYCGDGDYVAINSNGAWYDKVNCNDYYFIMEIPCGNPITITQTSGPANGSFLNGGTTEVVTYVATDQVTGATATCSFTITVEQCVPEYCESSAACTAYEWIDQVSLGSIGNQSGNDNGYGDYTSMTTVASPGDVVNLQLTPGFSGTSYTETWRVWVDWNYDGDFYDQGELVYQGYGNSTLNGSFTVPSWATTDLGLRVRVSMRWNCYAGPCSYFQYGEVEDYTLFVTGGSQGMAVNNAINGTSTDSFKDNGFTPKNNVDTYSEVIEDVSVGGIGLELGDIYPNPVLASNGLFNLNIRTGQKTDVSVRIVDLSGKVLLTEVMQLETGANKRQLDVTGFARGSYLVEVISENMKETTQLVVQ